MFPTLVVARKAAAASAPHLRHRWALQKLSEQGVQALKPQKVVPPPDAPFPRNHAELRGKWRAPIVSKRQANVMRRNAIRTGSYGSFDPETLVGWDPAWDLALADAENNRGGTKGQQGRYRINKPKLPKRHRTREERAKKIEEKMKNMDDQIEEYYLEKEKLKPEKNFVNMYKKMMQVKRR